MEDVLAARLGLPSDSRVLDAGCGTGAVARSLASRHGLRVTGIDLLDWNLKEAIAKSAESGLAARTAFQWGDYHHLDFPGESFDGVYSMEALAHAAKPDLALAEFFRVLRPGGRLALFEYSHAARADVSAEAYAALEKVCAAAAMPGWLEFQHGVLEQKLTASGFQSVDSADVTPRMIPMLKAFNLLGRLPYYLATKINKGERAVNAMSAVEMYCHREAWRYNAITAVKPASSTLE
jgi:ubiquinone/menaquinone biosynthesis C-methylase UbiE